MRNTPRFARLWRWTQVAAFLVATTASGRAEDISRQSRWDKELPHLALRGVLIKSNTLLPALGEIRTKYSLRANIYFDTRSYSDSTTFAFRQDTATGQQLIEAFLAVFSDYSHTWDPETGVLWVYPKQKNYADILNQQVRIATPARQVPALNSVLVPLCKLLSPRLKLNPRIANRAESFNYAIDLAPGVYSVRQLLDLCCLGHPSKAFTIESEINGLHVLTPVDLNYRNPLSGPRSAAVKFWEVEIGHSPNGVPTAEEVSAAMCDSNPRKRWAARMYLEIAGPNYRWNDLIGNGDDPDRALWVALGLEAALFPGQVNEQFLPSLGPAVTNSFSRIQNPGLALLTCLKLASIKKDTTHLEALVSRHKFSEAEVASIKPDVYRMFHESQQTRDKLKSLKLAAIDFSAEALNELEKTNLFTLLPERN